MLFINTSGVNNRDGEKLFKLKGDAGKNKRLYINFPQATPGWREGFNSWSKEVEEELPKEWSEAAGWGQICFFVSPEWATSVSLRLPSPRPAKSAEGPATSLGTAAIAPNPTPGRTARGKKLFRYFFHFLDLFGQNC